MELINKKVLEKYPLQMDKITLHQTLRDIKNQIDLYQGIIKNFESQYHCDLDTFEKKIESAQLPEHPSWEISIEWGVAFDELQRLQVLEGALQWMLNFLS